MDTGEKVVAVATLGFFGAMIAGSVGFFGLICWAIYRAVIHFT
jgi:hypothetical protein